MTTLDNLLIERRSVRKYSEAPSPSQDKELIKAAKMAPSAGGIRPVTIIITDGHSMRNVSRQKMFRYPCSAYIFCVDFPKIQKRYKDRGIRYALLEVGHMAQNVCLKALDLGLVSCCVGAFDDKKLKEFLSLPGRPVYIVAAGKRA